VIAKPQQRGCLGSNRAVAPKEEDRQGGGHNTAFAVWTRLWLSAETEITERYYFAWYEKRRSLCERVLYNV